MELELTIKNYRCFPDTSPARIVLSRGLTGFVGVNDSGKSSLLKFFYEFRPLLWALRGGELLSSLAHGGVDFQVSQSVLDYAELFHDRNLRNLQIELKVLESDAFREESPIPFSKAATLTISRDRRQAFADLDVTNELPPAERDRLNINGSTLIFKSDEVARLDALTEAFSALARTLYIGPFRNVLNIGTKSDYYDIQIGQSFVQWWRELKTGREKRKNEAAYKLTDEIRHMFAFDDLEMNPTADDQTLQVFINGKSYKLPELGSGLAQFIVVLGNAVKRESSYILIDEPESNLHPKLQLDFLTTLASYAQEGVLFATHSMGLARAGADRIYLVHKNPEGSELTDYEKTPRLAEFLGELNFSAYQELGFNKILLVEGPTEIKTMQQFLRKYDKDHTVVLLPLGGRELINQSTEMQLQEIKRISANISAVIDSERCSRDAQLDSTREGFVRLCRQIGIDCHVLERRAIENYFSERAVQIIKGGKYRALTEYELLRDAPLGWAKADNWRIAREMTLEELKDTDLGQFLGSL